MRNTLKIALAAALGALCLCAPAGAAEGQFGLKDLDVSIQPYPGGAANESGSHPFSYTTELAFETAEDPDLKREVPIEGVKDISIAQIEGLVGDQTAVPKCLTKDFLAEACPVATQIGFNDVVIEDPETLVDAALYNLNPPPGSLARLGFTAVTVPITIDVVLNPEPPYNLIAQLHNVSSAVPVYSAKAALWGVPADEAHDSERVGCGVGGCSVNVVEKPLLTMPRACAGPLETIFKASSWGPPSQSSTPPPVLTHDDSTPPAPLGFTGCSQLGFEPSIDAKPTNVAASSPSGLDFSLEIADESLSAPDGRAGLSIRRAEVTLPEGFTANPSLAEGLTTCSEADLSRESADSGPGDGCPQASKIGTVSVHTPLVEETLGGALYVAEPYRNPFGSLLALYFVIKSPNLGVSIVQAAKIEPDPKTGQLVTIADEIPQLPFSSFTLHFREGGRSPLITPPRCGTYTAKATLTPYTGEAVESSSTFGIVVGPHGDGCPTAAPFAPGFGAGSANNAAGAYSPFSIRLTRADGEQDLTKFSAVLPPGVSGRIAGAPWCPEGAIAAAGARDGRDELASPSCPAASQIGRVVAGAGVGSALTYVNGALYLAGPYKGAPLSVAAIVPAVAGPFDVGTVVTRVGLRLNPKTGQVEVDGAASDPIPHILAGIPLNVRDIRVLADRPSFTLNPTDCSEFNTYATIWGSGGDAFSDADDVPFGAAARYQAANCASLAFAPKLAIKLFGGVKRGAFPALRAVVTPPPGQANFASAAVTLPRSAFLEQGHIRTICTRVQFAAGPGNGALCPQGAQYGYARAWSPLLDEPAQGPVYLRSSNNKLPDLVVALKGPASAPVDIELSARIDSVKGGIRSTFNAIPDLPVSRFILAMQGGKKGLIVNSRHLCFKPKRNRAKANLVGQNGVLAKSKPRVIAAGCQKKRKKATGKAK